MRKESFDAMSDEAIRKMMQDEYASVSASEQLIQRTLKAVRTEIESQNIVNDPVGITKKSTVSLLKWWPRYTHAALVAAGLVMVLIVGTIWFPRIGSRNAESDMMAASTTMAARMDGRGVAESNDLENGAYKSAAPAETTTAGAMPTEEAPGTADASETLAFLESSPDVIFGMTATMLAPDSIDMSLFDVAPSVPSVEVLEQVKLLQPLLPEGAVPQTDHLISIQTLNPGLLYNNTDIAVPSNEQLLSGKTYLMVPVVDSGSLFIGSIPLFYSNADLTTIISAFPNAMMLDNSGWLTIGFVPTTTVENPLVLMAPDQFAAQLVGEPVTNVSVVDMGSGMQFSILFRAQDKDWLIPYLQMPLQTTNGVAYETQEFVKLIRSNP